MQMIPVRIFFQKKGRLKYISHLDTMSAFSRAIVRAKLPVWFTEGFNPHVYITFPMPLSLGYEGRRECFDIRVVEPIDFEKVKDALNKVLPDDLGVLEICAPKQDAAAIAWADYSISLGFKDNVKKIAEDLEAYTSRDRLIVEKKSKKRVIEVDIAPFIRVQNINGNSAENCVELSIRLAAGIAFNINPRTLLQSFFKEYNYAPLEQQIARIGFYDANEKEFI